jgi:hypothetical protein
VLISKIHIKTCLLALSFSILPSLAGAAQLQLDSVVYWNAESAADNPNYTGSARDISRSTATWDFDGMTLTGDGVFSSTFGFSPLLFIFNEVIEDMSISMDGAVSATSYTCVDGGFLAVLGVFESTCGQYTFGANGIDESSLTYSGTTLTRTIGGDDIPIENNDGVLFDPYQLIFWYGFEIDSWDGETLLMQQLDSNGSGKIMAFSVVPIPAAAWLFGSALLGLASLKRKK